MLNWLCRWLHRQGLPYNRDGKTYQRCFGSKRLPGCSRELLCKVQFPGRDPWHPYTEQEMTAIERYWAEEQEPDVATMLDRQRGKR